MLNVKQRSLVDRAAVKLSSKRHDSPLTVTIIVQNKYESRTTHAPREIRSHMLLRPICYRRTQLLNIGTWRSVGNAAWRNAERLVDITIIVRQLT